MNGQIAIRGTRRAIAKMGSLVGTGVLLATVTSSGNALAETKPDPAGRNVFDADHASGTLPRHRTFGMSLDMGIPDGAALGLVVRPKYDWIRLGAAATHNGMAPGVRLGVTLDPIDFAIAPTLTAEGGHYWEGTVPIIKDAPAIGYNYANFHVGLEVGGRASFRFFLRGGASWVDVRTAHFQSAAGGSGVGNPSFNGWLAPSGKLGFSAFF